MPHPDIALFGSFPKTGGITRTLLNVTRVWVDLGLNVEIVLFRNGVPFHPEKLPAAVTVKRLGTTSKLTTQLALFRYLLARRPAVLFSTKHVANVMVCRCHRLPGNRTRLVLRVSNNYFRDNTESDLPARQRKFKEIMRHYPKADAIITVSKGLRQVLRKNLGLADTKTYPIGNSVDSTGVRALAKAPIDHPWFAPGEPPVAITAGRLNRQKDHPTLLRAFRATRERLASRLVILGGGPERARLEALADNLGIASDVAFLGHVENPYAYMARSDLFVLSSLWEGFPNVLAEALTVGVPIVSTACPHGPEEILKQGEYGDLVPVGDWQALAGVMTRSLEGHARPFDREAACARFDINTAAWKYLQAFGLVESV